MKPAIRIIAVLLLLGYEYPSLAETVTLKDGRKLTGAIGQISGMAEDPRQAGRGSAPTVRSILFVDDNLTRRFVPKPRVASVSPSDAQADEFFVFKQPVLRNGNKLISRVGPALRVDPLADLQPPDQRRQARRHPGDYADHAVLDQG
jgi:hypothetical protein